MMSTPEETVKAMTAFYQQVVKHLSFDSDALKIAPVEGWPDLDPSVKDKSAAVLELLRHLPYLHLKDPYDLLCVYDSTAAVSYLPGNHRTGAMDDIFPTPSHCVYLTSCVGQHGYSLILDTSKGKIRRVVTVGNKADIEQAHGLALDMDYGAGRGSRAVDEDVCSPSEAVGEIRMADPHRAEERAQEVTPWCEWYPDDLELHRTVGEADSEDFLRYKMVQAQYDVDNYNCYIRFGWPENFDRAACKLEVIKLVKLKDRTQSRYYALNNPETPFNALEEAEEEARVERRWNPQLLERKATGGKAPRKPRPNHSRGLEEIERSAAPRDGDGGQREE
ncbi:unnamed protein product [Zymoseptoria tritici ST99CH_1A5]|nr:unnamed protein product [Zymoseptoria tritici ST99CH_1A5]